LVETVILEDSSLDELRAATSTGMGGEPSLSMADLEASEMSEETSEFEYELATLNGVDDAADELGTLNGMNDTPDDTNAVAITEILPDDERPMPELAMASIEDDDFSIDFDMPESNGAATANGIAAIPDVSQTIKITEDDKEELLELPEFSLDGLDDAMSGEDEMATKLDLAKAYVDMGDDEGARDALNEVISSGNDQQRVEAERLLNQLH